MEKAPDLGSGAVKAAWGFDSPHPQWVVSTNPARIMKYTSIGSLEQAVMRIRCALRQNPTGHSSGTRIGRSIAVGAACFRAETSRVDRASTAQRTSRPYCNARFHGCIRSRHTPENPFHSEPQLRAFRSRTASADVAIGPLLARVCLQPTPLVLSWIGSCVRFLYGYNPAVDTGLSGVVAERQGCPQSSFAFAGCSACPTC